VRAALLSQELSIPWPPYSATINEENITVPIVVYNLLAWILCEDGEGEDERVNVDKNCQPLVLKGKDDLKNVVIRFSMAISIQQSDDFF